MKTTRVLLIAFTMFFSCVVMNAEDQQDPVFARVKRVLVESLGVDEGQVTLGSYLTALGMTAENQEDVKRDLEVAFGILIPEEDFDRMSTVGDVVTFFRNKSPEDER